MSDELVKLTESVSTLVHERDEARAALDNEVGARAADNVELARVRETYRRDVDEARAIARRLAAELRECGIYGVSILAAFDALPWAKDSAE